MAQENRDFAWLRKTLCDEIDAVRSGKADHNRAKSVAGLAMTALKSVEVEAMLRQQQTDLNDAGAPALGSLPLCSSPPMLEEQRLNDNTSENHDVEESVEKEEPEELNGRQPDEGELVVNGFKVGDRVMCPNGKRGTVKNVAASGRIEVAEDGGGTFPYTARHLEALTKTSEPIRSPIVPQGPRGR